MTKRQWSDKYGSRWYLHYDGQPPHDDDNDYRWNGCQWIIDNGEASNMPLMIAVAKCNSK